jgi:uncharacterized protein (TIGR03435 family)
MSQLKRIKPILLGLLCITGPLVAGVAGAVQLHAQLLHATTSPPSFEVATIKPNKEDRPGINIQFSPGNFATRHSSLKGLIKIAYQVRSDDQVVGGPSWMSTEFCDIQAKASESEIESINKVNSDQRMEQSKLLIQPLLADRFQLKVSFKTAELPAYALDVAKGGPKLAEVEVSPFPPPGTPPPPGAHPPRISRTAPNQYTASAWPMNMMPDWLSHFDEIGSRVAIDETWLKGNYDFVLKGVTMVPASPANPNEGGPPESTTSIFTAIQEQLGLKLESRKAQMEVLVIDHAERPSEN